MDTDFYGRLLFEVEGKPMKSGLLKKHVSYVGVFEKGMLIKMWGDTDAYHIDDIIDIYVKEPVVGEVTSRTTMVLFYEDGEEGNYELENDIFPELAEKMARLIEREWSFIKDRRNYPDSVKWFIACTAVVQISSEQNPYIFGSNYKDPEAMKEQRKELFDSWGINQKADLLKKLESLYDGRAVKSYHETIENLAGLSVGELEEELGEDLQFIHEKIARAGGENCVWAWDLQRLILLSSLAYVCDYLAWEDSLDWCLKAGQKLQKLFHGWDEFMNCYLLGYCLWAEERLDDEESEAHERLRAYEYYKKLRNNPWSIDWNHSLLREW
jgi:hypothetical protein